MADEEHGAGAPEGVWSVVGQHAGWGLTIAASIGLFLWAGYAVDRRLGTLPLLTIVGALGGGAAAFYSMYRRLVVEPREARPGAGDADGPGTDE